MKRKVKIGIDLGGSHVGVGVVDTKGNIIEIHEKDFTVEEKLRLIDVAIEYIVEIINELKKKYSFSKIGIGVPGTIQDGVILKSVNLNLEKYDIKSVLKEKTNLDITVQNDAKCAAWAEYKYGIGKNYNNIIFLTLGTGIGGCYIYQGKIVKGTKYSGFEFGHMVMQKDGILCNCGKKGCFERYGSILCYKKRIIEELNLPVNISGPELRKHISENLDRVKYINDDYTRNLAIGLSNLVNIFEPDVVIIGGGFARYDYLLLKDLKEQILNSKLLFNTRDDLEIKVATLGNDAGIVGAAVM